MRDGILEACVRFAEIQDEPLETSITLLVGGFLVSGQIISKKKFIQLNPLTAWVQDVLETQPQEEQQAPEDDWKRRFIHLRNAKYFSPGQPPVPDNEGITCRIKISDVSGFNFGQLATAPDGQ